MLSTSKMPPVSPVLIIATGFSCAILNPSSNRTFRTFALSAVAVAVPPPPATPAPVAVPYPNTSAQDAAAGLPTGKRMHKPYTLAAPDAAAAQSTSCAATTNVAPVNVASDPEEAAR